MKKIILGLVAALTITATAYAAGLFQNFPVVGGSAYCSSYSTGVNGQVCTTNIPAGPTGPTGNELVPADTQLPQGRSPQTVLLPLRAFNAAPLQFVDCTPVSGVCGSTTISDTSSGIFFSYASGITSATVVMPASPFQGQRVTIGADHTIATLTMTANTGQTFAVTAPTVLTASATVPQGYEFMYVGTVWYKVH